MSLSLNRFMVRIRDRVTENRPGFFHVKAPVWMRLPKHDAFNFIILHYVYLIVMTLVGSILLYPAGVMDYTDALFFAAGAATQSGLNTYRPLFALVDMTTR
jgi:hypothetical protein